MSIVDSHAEPMPAKKSGLTKFLPLLVIAGAVGLVFAMGWHKYLSLDVLAKNITVWDGWIQSNLLLAMLVFALVYAVAVALSIPGAGILTISGGVLFGWAGVFPTVLGATVGATGLFFAAKTAFRDLFASKAGKLVAKFEQGFKENEFSYMLILRLVPLFPFWLINVVPAFLGVKLSTYFLATLIGIVPGSLTYTLIGAAGKSTLAQGGKLNLAGAITQPTVLAAIGGLIVLSLIPVAYKRFSANKSQKVESHAQS